MHVAEEEGQDQRHDVATVYVGVTHDDDLVVTQLVQVQHPFAVLALYDAHAQGGKHVFDLLILVDLVLHGLLYVEDLPPQRQDRLELPVAALLGRTPGRVTLHQEDLRTLGVLIGAVGQFAGQAGAGQYVLTLHHLAGLAGGVTGRGGDDYLVDDALSLVGVLLQPVADALPYRPTDDTGYLGVAEFALSLPLELRLGHLDGYHGGQALAEVLPADLELQLLEQSVLVPVLGEQAIDGAAEAVHVRPPLARLDVVDEGVDVLLVGGVVLHGHLDLHVVLLGLHVDRLLDQVLLALVEVLDHLGQSALAVELLAHEGTILLGLPLVRQTQVQSAVQEGQLLHPAGQGLVLVHQRFEDRSVRLEVDRRTRMVGRTYLVYLVEGLALTVVLLVDLAVAVHRSP